MLDATTCLEKAAFMKSTWHRLGLPSSFWHGSWLTANRSMIEADPVVHGNRMKCSKKMANRGRSSFILGLCLDLEDVVTTSVSATEPKANSKETNT